MNLYEAAKAVALEVWEDERSAHLWENWPELADKIKKMERAILASPAPAPEPRTVSYQMTIAEPANPRSAEAVAQKIRQAQQGLWFW